MTAIDTSLQAQVDAQLLEQGAFAPLELLFNSGRLLYSDYESWRRREIDLLDGVLMGNPDKIKAQIEQAVSYARRIKLVEQPQEFHAWHQSATVAQRRESQEAPQARRGATARCGSVWTRNCSVSSAAVMSGRRACPRWTCSSTTPLLH